jgi:hypothetical protein
MEALTRNHGRLSATSMNTKRTFLLCRKADISTWGLHYPVYSYVLRRFNIAVFKHRVNSLQLPVPIWVTKFEKIIGCFHSTEHAVWLCESGVWDYIADGRQSCHYNP